jgi:hypothetical protein
MKKKLLRPQGRLKNRLLVCLVITILAVAGCKKSGNGPRDEYKPSSFTADVIDKWFTLEIRLFKNGVGIANGAFARPFAYSGICAYESIDPEVSWKNKYNGLSGLPAADEHKTYYWPASVNTSLAEFNRSFFTPVNSSAADLAAIDSLEKAINSTFTGISGDLLDRSTGFGKSVADVIFSWSRTDGYDANNALPYTFPIGPGLWIPTPTAFAKASGPFWGNNRPIIAGSGDNAQPGPPMAYSEDPKSPFYQMANDLYIASKNLTTDQTNWALFWRDSPGITTPGHWMSIIQQLIRQTHSQLDKAALTYALVGICLNDAVISVFKTKYIYNLIRPVTYIRKVFGDTAWLPAIPTPAHTEYASAHAVVSASASKALVALFGDIGPLADHTYDYLGFPARTFKSLSIIAADAGNSRFYGGIHFQPSIDISLTQGNTVGGNILKSLGKF